MSPRPSPSPHGPRQHGTHPLLAALLVSAGAALASLLLPDDLAATAVGLWFLGATYFLALRRAPPDGAARWGLSLGGLLDPEPLSVRRLSSATARALGTATLAAAITFPPFWLGFRAWYGIDSTWRLGVGALDLGFVDEALGQLLVIALPEEAFFRGYLQTALDERWPPRRTLLGAPVGWSLLVTSAVFAIGHLATAPDPGRLAVFFPSLLFGWLRARTGGIGASVAYHATCNLFATVLGRGYGLLP